MAHLNEKQIEQVRLIIAETEKSIWDGWGGIMQQK